MTQQPSGKRYDYDELFPGRFLKAGELKGQEVTLRIAAILVEELEDQKGKRRRGILGFEGTSKQVVLNRTNGECLKAMFGRDTGVWIGKRITLHAPMVDAFGKRDIAIRVLGSPEIARDLAFTLKLPRKKEISVTMKRTKAGQARVQDAPPPEPPPADPPLEEPPADVVLPGQTTKGGAA